MAGRQLASAWVSVSPTGFKDFGTKAKEGIRTALKGADAMVPVKADTKPAVLSVDALKAKLTELSRTVATARLEAADKEALAKLAGFGVKLDALGRRVSSPRISLEGVARAEADMLAIDASLDRIDGRRVTATVDVRQGPVSRLSGLLGGGGGAGGGVPGGLTGVAAGIGVPLAAALTPAVAGLGIGGAVGGGAIAGGLFGAAEGKKVLNADQATIKILTTKLKTAIGQQKTEISAALKDAEKQYAKDAAFFAPFTAFQASLQGLAQTLLAPLRGVMLPLAAMFDQFGKGLTALGPQLAAMFKASLPFVRQFLEFMLTAGKTLIPAFTTAMNQMVSSGALKSMSDALVIIVQGLAGFITALGPGMASSATIFKGLAVIIGTSLRVLGGVFAYMANTFADNAHSIRLNVHHMAEMFDDFRHRTAVIFDGVRHDIAHVWDQVFSNTVGSVIRIGHNVLTQYDSLRHGIAGKFDSIRHDIAHAWDVIWDNTVGRAKTGITAFGAAASGIKNAMLTPIRWVVNNVIDRLISAFDWVSSKVGGPVIKPFKFATGGRVPGSGLGDVVPAMLTPGEVVVPVGMVASGAVDHLRGMLPGFQHGGQVPNVGQGLHTGTTAQPAGPALGPLSGVLGGIGDLGKILAAVTTGNPVAASNAFKALLGTRTGGAVADLAGLLAAIPGKLLSAAVSTLLGLGASGGGSAGDIVSYAMSLLGRIPYVWGGTSITGADCSGFTGLVLAHAGYRDVPRTSEAQGSWVSLTNTPQAGGLAFYHSPPGGPDPGHVAIIRNGTQVISQGGGLGPKLMGLHGMPLLWTGIPPGGFSQAPGGGGAAGPGAAGAQAWMRGHLGDYGWGPGQWGSLVALWNGECLTLDAVILTRRGWLTHDQVRPGDETIGYNPATGRSEWTRIERVVRYDDAEVWRIGGPRWHADVTPGHRWWSDGRKNNGRGHIHEQSGFVRTDELAYGDRIRLAAPADTDGIPGLSTEDAAILAWIQGDGHIQRRHGRTEGARIYQSKPAQITRLRALLAHTEHTEACYRQDKGRPEYVFLLRSGYTRDLLKRSGLDETGPEQMVLRMSPDQRAAWLTAMIDAEGHAKGGYVIITQNDGELARAIQLAIYLEGHRPNVRVHQYGKAALSMGLGNPHVAVHRFGPHQVLDRQPVWCVTTGLGTWTAKQDDRVFLTGNSGWRWNAQNPTSPAYGIPQADPGSKMASVGADWRTNPVTQMRWGAEYIRGTYGNPDTAYGDWLGRHPHWYGGGGLVPGYAAGGTLPWGQALLHGWQSRWGAGTIAGQGQTWLNAWRSRRGGGYGAAWGPVVLNEQIPEMGAAIGRAKTLSRARGLSGGQHKFWAAAAADETRRLGVLKKELSTEQAWRGQLSGTDAQLAGYIKAAGSIPALAGNVRSWKAQLKAHQHTIGEISGMLGYSNAYLKAHPPAPKLPGVKHVFGGDVGNTIAAYLASVMAPFGRGGMVRSYDNGGYLAPGLTMAWNGTGRPEPVGTPGLAVTFEVGSTGDPAFDAVMLSWLRRTVKVRGGTGPGSVERALGSR